MTRLCKFLFLQFDVLKNFEARQKPLTKQYTQPHTGTHRVSVGNDITHTQHAPKLLQRQLN